MSAPAGQPWQQATPAEPTPAELRATFDSVAERYERARPGCPDEVYELLADRCGLGPGADVLEIGPGPGTATLPILDLGARVVAVELGKGLTARLSARARGRCPEVVVGPFEHADLEPGAFDLAVSADVPLGRCGHRAPEGAHRASARRMGWWNVWIGRHDSAEMRDLFGTFSNVPAMAEAQRVALLDGIEAIVDERFGGVVERPYVTALYVGRKP